MADGIFIPPWLKGVDPAEVGRLHAAGLEIGQRAAAEQNRMLLGIREQEQRQNEMAMRAAIAQKEIELETQKQQRMAAQFEQEMQMKRAEERRNAMLSASRFAGTRKYQEIMSRLSAAGVPPDEARRQAMLESAPYLMPVAPGQALNAIQRSMPIPPPKVQTFDQTSKIPPAVIDAVGRPHWPPSGGAAAGWDESQMGQVKSVTEPGTGRNIGFVVRRGPGSASFVPQRELNPMEQLALKDLYAQKSKTQDSLSEAEDRLSGLDQKKSPKAYQATKAQVDRLIKKQADIQQAISEMTSGKVPGAPRTQPATGGIRIREKKTGKIMRYKGNREDIPADQYDILD